MAEQTGKKLSASTLKKCFWNWFFWNGCSQQAESMLGLAFGQSMAPVIDELYDTKEEKAAALKRHTSIQHRGPGGFYLQRYCLRP